MAESSSQPTKQKLWGGRFTGKTDPLMHEFNQSLRYDKRMYAVDIAGSIAYAKALTLIGILTKDEENKIVEGLKTVEKEWETGVFSIQPDDEDIHTANERRLSEIIGKLGGKLHTGRSRNDQVATDMRLWLLDEVKHVTEGLSGLIRVMVERADKEKDILLPGYTHLQRGQPIRWSHLLLSHAFSFHSDLQRLQQLIPRVSVLPLGCGALAGNPFVVDREFLRKELGFQSVAENSLYGVGDRDFIVEFLMWASLAMTHISRMAEDLIVYSTAEFGTGSSIMPQKKNPDSLELLRGKSGRVFGNMAGFLMTLKGLPSTYNKDLQEDKEPLFDAVDTVSASFKIAEGVIATMEVHAEKMRSALTMDVLATDLADYLVRKGIPFRETHHISGRAVALAESRKCQLNELTLQDFQGLNEKFAEDIHQVFDFEASVERRESIGGTSRKMVERQVLAALRAQQGNTGSDSYPMQSNPADNYPGRRPNPFDDRGAVDPYDSKANSTTNLTSNASMPAGSADAMSAFYSEISSIQDDIRTFNDNVSRISDLHSRSLDNTDEASVQRVAQQLEDLVQDTSALSNVLKRRIKALEKQAGGGRDGQIRKQQTGLVKQKFVEAIQSYQSVEQQYRTKYKQRLERQFKIVKPDASPEEVKAVVNDDQGGQIFSQALMNSNRYGEARSAYREVQERHDDIVRIEKTITELAQLFNDMSVLVEQQDETIHAIETTAATVEKDTEQGLNYTEKAVDSARAARKKRWICFGLAAIILIIIAIIIVVAVLKAKNN
ncbi:argininosuccinate lyase [Steccherinum ochraceum]|uniref:argininosuccinate lyase n=1 Tax=Steccherinum ochraceum TaxID=92696 RepID=A0A4R0R142_9APHY|nr:argininosuccinate lyase [Steccherinum ochraceum]